jgi:hypothetical protein
LNRENTNELREYEGFDAALRDIGFLARRV